MKSSIKHFFVVIALLGTAMVNASTPTTDDLDKLNIEVPKATSRANKVEKVNTEEVKEVFLKIKRVDRIFTPKKRLRKKKYTIA